jgi:hypothetical protein
VAFFTNATVLPQETFSLPHRFRNPGDFGDEAELNNRVGRGRKDGAMSSIVSRLSSLKTKSVKLASGNIIGIHFCGSSVAVLR